MAGGNIDENTSIEGFRALTDIPLFLGYIISFLLQGVLIVQVFAYCIAFKADRRVDVDTPILLLVWIVFILEWVSTIIATLAALESLAVDGRLADLTFGLLFKSLSPLCGLVVLAVHAFYSFRIYVVGAHIAIPIVIFTLSIVQCLMVIIAGFKVDSAVN
ncbi:hypothetical protein V5O48_012275 [Marasmius crinis-equi]|uniref:Yip1 domain-containing protein n=1 Tax=Marasmius crinis-equi TaxID=585013 RepID=A0ABR3F3U7_9AGAR